jgi:hypothetical protein
MSTRRTPADLAKFVMNYLRHRKMTVPSLKTLTSLFETLYAASLKTEESHPTYCYIVYLDPTHQDEIRSEDRAFDHWSCVELATRIPLTPSSLVKVAKASDPRTSSFAVYHDSMGELFIWGLVDQGNRYHEYVNFNTVQRPDRPGLFQASILGIGHLVAYREYERIAELNIDTLVTESHDILRYGPIRQLLQPAIDEYLAQVKTAIGIEKYGDGSQWAPRLSEMWTASICRILLRIRGFRHGGALLITPNLNDGLNVKYQLAYNRLNNALIHWGNKWIEKRVATDLIEDALEGGDAEEIPTDLFLDDALAGFSVEESTLEMDGTIWFISLLSRVDGLVLLTRNLEARGFGVEILTEELPRRIVTATTATATPRSRKPVDYQHFGTRHRSMMRYCFAVPGSIGFVVSQDGDVRAMTRIDRDLVIWDSIRLQLDKFGQPNLSFGKPAGNRTSTDD